MESTGTRVLKPSPKMKKLYWTYYALVVVPCLLAFLIPTLVTISFVRADLLTATVMLLGVLAPFILATLVVAYWIGAYYERAKFVLTEDGVVVERGVWWRHKSVVPYDRITNVGIIQGPISRLYGLATVRVHTAGYHAVSGGAGGVPVAEAEIFHVENADVIADEVMAKVREKAPLAVEAAPGAAITTPRALMDILAELKHIREILEGQGGR